jgi:hypothetical protein
VAWRVTTRAVPPHVLGLSTSIGAPAGACSNCWRAWLVGPRDAIGYCWHGKVAWRVKSGGELAVAADVTRDQRRAMLEYVSEMAAVMQPIEARDAPTAQSVPTA